MKKYILFILLLYSICAQSQISSYDSLNIQYAEELINFNSQVLSLPWISKYMVFISSYECMITFVEDNYYKTLYYHRKFYGDSNHTFELINFEREEINNKSMFYDIFQQSDCITEFVPDSLLIIDKIYPNRNIFFNPLDYFVLYKYGEKECEFSYTRKELKENIILYNKKYADYLSGKLVKGAIIPYYYERVIRDKK